MYIPLQDMPTSMHFFKRQARQFVRVFTVISHLSSPEHRYWPRSPIERLKNFWNQNDNNAWVFFIFLPLCLCAFVQLQYKIVRDLQLSYCSLHCTAQVASFDLWLLVTYNPATDSFTERCAVYTSLYMSSSFRITSGVAKTKKKTTNDLNTHKAITFHSSHLKFVQPKFGFRRNNGREQLQCKRNM